MSPLVGQIESAHKQKESRELVPGLRTFENENFRIRMKSQADLLAELEAAGKTVKWGQLIRAPDVFFEILERAGKKLVPLNAVTEEIKRGQRTVAPKNYQRQSAFIRGLNSSDVRASLAALVSRVWQVSGSGMKSHCASAPAEC
jgi:hypothetical protein